MNELETIQSIIRNAEHSKNYNEEEYNGGLKIYNTVVSVLKDINNLTDLTDDVLNSLKMNYYISPSEALLIKSYIINKKYNKNDAIDKRKLNDILSKVEHDLGSVLNKLTNIKAINLSKKIKDGFINLTEDDLDTLFKIVRKDENYTTEQKRDLLIYVSLNLVNGIIDDYEDDYKEIEDSDKGLTIEELTELFSKHNYDVSILTDKNKEDLLKRGNYEQMDKILSLLDRYNINLLDNNMHNLLKEKQDNIKEILIRSNERCTEEILKFANDYGVTTYDGDINFYKLACAPGKFALKQRPYKKKINTGSDPGKPSPDKFAGTHQDFMANVNYFSTICEEIYGKGIDFVKEYFNKRNGVLLDYPHEKILEIVSVLESYGLHKRDYFSQATTVFATIHQADVLDFAIERDMYDYIKQNPSRMALDKKIFDTLYVASLDKPRFLGDELKSDFIGNQTLQQELKLKDIYKYLETNPIKDEDKGIKLDESLIESFEQTIKAYPFDVTVYDSDTNIKLLEDNFKENDLVYNIGGVRISRLKVLRIYNALKENPHTDEKNKFIYAVTRNTYMNNEQYSMMVNAYNEVANSKRLAKGGEK